MLSCRVTCPGLPSHLPPMGHLPQDIGARHLYYCLPRCPLWLEPCRHSFPTRVSSLEAVGAYKISGCLASVAISCIFRGNKVWLWLRWSGWTRGAMAFPLQFIVRSVILNCYSTLLTPLVLLHQKTWAVVTVHGYDGAIGSWQGCELPNCPSSNKAPPQTGTSLLLSGAARCSGNEEVWSSIEEMVGDAPSALLPALILGQDGPLCHCKFTNRWLLGKHLVLQAKSSCYSSLLDT